MMNKASAKGANTALACEAATQIMIAAMIPTGDIERRVASHAKFPEGEVPRARDAALLPEWRACVQAALLRAIPGPGPRSAMLSEASIVTQMRGEASG